MEITFSLEMYQLNWLQIKYVLNTQNPIEIDRYLNL